MPEKLIKDARIVNEGRVFEASILIRGDKIDALIMPGEPLPQTSGEIIDAGGRMVIPGIIDDQVHFREPGLTHKGDIRSESRAAVAGGVTSYMEMPNTLPRTITIAELERKHELASGKSLANFGFYLGATNDNLAEIRKLDAGQAPGIKIFMGSSTGNMLVDKKKSLEAIFAESPVLLATHCEDEAIIRRQSKLYREQYGEEVPISCHPEIRNEEACYRSTARAVDLARKYGARLHVLHISTKRELGLFGTDLPSEQKQVTAEVCVHHLWFEKSDYERMGSLIKWNPAIKTAGDREGLRAGLLEGRLDVIATDHAPHTLEEKKRTYFNAPSGGPMVQHSLVAMMELCRGGLMDLPALVEKMCHAPARIFRVKDRGFIRPGYFADLVILEDAVWTVTKDNILYKCGWSPFGGQTFSTRVVRTLVNGRTVYRWEKQGQKHIFEEGSRGMRLEYNR